MLENEMKISLTLVAFDKMSKVLRDAVHKSNEEFAKLQNKIQQTSEMLDKLGTNMIKLGAGLTATGGALAYKLGITEAIPEALALEHQLRELGNVGQLSAEQLKEMDERLGSISRHTNQFRSEIAEGLNVLVASGVAPEKALEYMQVIGKTATAAGAEISDISKTAFSLTDNLKVPVSELNRTMDILAQAGKEGRFELKDMASAFPSLTAGASMLGMKGVPAVTQLGAALQVAMKGAGSAPEAANNLENFIQKVTSPLAVKNFQENFGINLKDVLNNAAAQKKDVILEVLEVMQKASGGDIFKVSEVFQDKQVLSFIKPMLQNLDEYKRIKQSALSAEGIVDSDYSHMMETTVEQWKQLRINMKELVFPHLHAPLAALNNLLTKINSNPVMQKGIFTAVIGTIGGGLALTLIGTATMLTGKLVGVYGDFLVKARELTPVLIQNSVKLLEFLGLKSTAHNVKFGFQIAQAGDKMGLTSAFSVKNGVFADIRRIDNNLRNGIIKGLKELPSNIAKSSVALKDWTVTSIKAIPTNFMAGLQGLKTGFLSIPRLIKTAILSFRAFSLTLLTSPLGWIALAIAGVAFVIFKYWKPITGFFKGVFQGLKEGLAPLMPAFNKLAKALEPITKPIKAIFDWFKKLFTPVEDVGGAAEKMGVKFGKAIASIILKLTSLIKKAFECGAKIGDMLTFGLLSKLGKVKEAIGKHAQIIRDHLPHSPAKTGPLKDLHKIKISETIASSIKPMPIISAMNNALSFKTNGLRAQLRGANSGNSSTVINYNPTITISGATQGVKDDFLAMLKKHKEEILNIVRKENERKLRLAY
jgi:TP901 family phage tail tape measure protein